MTSKLCLVVVLSCLNLLLVQGQLFGPSPQPDLEEEPATFYSDLSQSTPTPTPDLDTQLPSTLFSDLLQQDPQAILAQDAETTVVLPPDSPEVRTASQLRSNREICSSDKPWS